MKKHPNGTAQRSDLRLKIYDSVGEFLVHIWIISGKSAARPLTSWMRNVCNGWIADVANSRCSAHICAMRARLAVVGVILGLTACGTGERPFRMVQFCLANTGEIGTMEAVLREVAAANSLPFYNNSKATEADLNSIASGQNNTPVAHPTVNVGTRGPTEMGFSAGNFAEAPSQIVVGFSKGDDAIAARKLSDAVVKALSTRWRIHEVPSAGTSGAFPLKDCDG